MNFIPIVPHVPSKCLSKWIKVDKWDYLQNGSQDFFFFSRLIFSYFFKYETIVRSSAWSFSHSDSDSSSVTKNQLPVDLCPQNSTAEVTLTKSLLLQACWSQGAMAPAYFKISVNPISTRLCPLHYYWPPNTHPHQWALYHDLIHDLVKV